MAKAPTWSKNGKNGGYVRTARSGGNKYTISRQQGKNIYTASGSTKAQAYRRLREGLGANGG